MAEGSATGRDEEAVRRFIERFALNLVEAGMARMPARVFAGVLVAEGGRRPRLSWPSAAGQPGGDLRRRALPDATAAGLP